MTMKVTAITVSVCAGVVSVLGLLFPNDPYFYAISSNLTVIIGRLVLCILMVMLVYEQKFRTIHGHRITFMAAAGLFIFSLIAGAIPTFDYSLFNYFKPLDYLFFANCAFVFGLAGLTYPQGKRNFNLPRLSRPRSVQLRPSLPRGI